VGRTNPAQKLDVAGNLRVSGDGTSITTITGGKSGTDDNTGRLDIAANTLNTNGAAFTLYGNNYTGRTGYFDIYSSTANGLIHFGNYNGSVWNTIGTVYANGGTLWGIGNSSTAGSVSNSIFNTVSPTAQTSSTIGTEAGFRIIRSGTNGDKYNSSADLNIGTYGTGLAAKSQLDIRLGNGNGHTPDVTVMSLLGNGSVGIGTTSPWRTLSVNGTVGFDGLTSANTGNYLCINTTTKEITSGTTCTLSSERFKQNIVPIGGSALDEVMKLQPVSFNFKSGYGDNGEVIQLGFIAEQAVKVDPRLVPLDENGVPNGFFYQNYTAILTKAIQEMNINIESIASTTDATATTSDSFASNFFKNLFARIGTWLADAANGLGNVFANAFHAKEEICVDDQCLTKDDVAALLKIARGQMANVGPSGSTSSGSGSNNSTANATDTTVPVITVVGNNPATITVGSVYADLGATVTDTDASGMVNNNLGIKYNVDGVDVQNILIDTSTSTTHTIIYSATDGAGNTGTATRTVDVVTQ
jgi:hypothetical protein